MAEQYHEPTNELTAKDRDFTRALVSLKEEIEAIMWYQQRASATKDETIREVLEHNRDEEMEHAAMLLEWLRRNMPGWDKALKTYLFTTEPLTQIEAEVSNEEESPGGDLKLRKIKRG
ncbi:MAG: ferritin-like domain-containing protein [Synergistetes bacterium]|nr:ferritin-like domain-containing protein [Synergistota bacterium]MCX8127530.1 ferritin-like domain-containing protein [Synergistota bacterium]MDW8191553.1 ferritin-like domain-containing protein [Synergistota bacterium]